MTAREVAAKLESHGWVLDRIKGSHYTYAKRQTLNSCSSTAVRTWGFLERGYSRKPV
ncbi:MAG: type II toxin-antitoxin system HicA family toxin [Spirochaetaceae bacterium]|nr:type II toxin-antitoxin system HicA family toxin [Spirochaetaceae bacterium]